MKSLTPKAAFESLGVYVRNYRWCWGGMDELARPCLRVWEDRIITIDGNDWVMVSHHSAYLDKKKAPGYNDRNKHLQLYKEGRETLLLVCTARDPDEKPRHIASVSPLIYYAGDMITIGGEQHMRMTRPEEITVVSERMRARKQEIIDQMNAELA